MIYQNTTIFDFETTGLNPNQDKIIEIAAVRIMNGKIVGTFSQLVNPEVPVPEFITNLTGISESDVHNAPTIREVLPWIVTLFGDSLLVAHNALFDLNYLQVNKMNYLNQSVTNNFLDTRTICINKFPYQSHKLDVICKQLNIKLEGAHRALNDVMATWEVLKTLDSQYGDTEQFVNKLFYFKKYGPPEWKPEYAEVIGL